MTLLDVWSVVAAALLSVGGAGGLILALSKFFGERLAERWLEGVKADYAKQLARLQHELDQLAKRHQARLDHSVTVSRVEFEEEFRAVREIWKFVARARAASVAIVETRVPEDDNKDKQLERFFASRQAFGEAHRKLVLAVDNNSPFYPQAIYMVVDTFRSRTTLELSQLQTRRPFEGD